MKIQKRKEVEILESQTFSDHRVDEEKGIVRDVLITGMDSKHGYSYSPGALKSATGLYEGCRVNIDHLRGQERGRQSRRYAERFGRLKSVHFVEGSGLRGDLHYNPRHALADQFAWDVQNNPGGVGLSHVAFGSHPKQRGSRGLVEDIFRVESVDVVADPATVKSLFEDEGDYTMLIRTKSKGKKGKSKMGKGDVRNRIAALIEDEEDRDSLFELMEEEGMIAEPAAAADTGGDDAVEGLIALIRRVLGDPNTSPEESIKKATKVMKALKEMIPGPADEGKKKAGEEVIEDLEDDDDTSDGKLMKLIESLASDVKGLKTRYEEDDNDADIFKVCKSKKFDPTPTQMKVLRLCEDVEGVEELIEEFAPTNRSGKRRFSQAKSTDATVGEGKTSNGYANGKAYAEGLYVGSKG